MLNEDLRPEYVTLGKREMLWAIQKQIYIIKNDKDIENKFDELCKSIKSIALQQNFEEIFYEFEKVLTENDMRMVNSSKRLSKMI